VEKMGERCFVSLDSVGTQKLDWGSVQWLSEPKVTGTTEMTTGVVTIFPGMGHSTHSHPGSEEMIIMLEGEGIQTVEVDGKVHKSDIKKGDLVHIPKGAPHSTFTKGDKPLVALAIFQHWADAIDFRNLPESIFEPPVNGEYE
jgi:oxalate decarboxylase/phosphoglucose isomerase-like protein (cupin superfamily)